MKAVFVDLVAAAAALLVLVSMPSMRSMRLLRGPARRSRMSLRAPHAAHRGFQPWICVLAFVAVLLSAGPMLASVLALVAVIVGRAAARMLARRAVQSADAAIGRELDELARLLRAGLAPAAALHAMCSSSASVGPGSTFPRAAPPAVLPDAEQSLQQWGSRTDTELRSDVRSLLVLGLGLGGLHPDFVSSVSSMHSARAQLDGEIAAQSSQAQASAVVMTVAPIVFLVALVLTDSDARRLVLETPLGSLLLVVGLALDAAAFVWMGRIARSVRVQ